MYGNLMIDPPWPKRKGGRRVVRPNQGRELAYATLDVREIFALLDSDVFPLAGEPHNAWLWVVDEFLVVAEEQMRERGYRLHARFVWDKGNGVAPAFTVRYSHEYLLWFYKPKLMPVAVDQRGKWRTVLSEASREHSRKPNVAYEMVESLYPDLKRLDVFSRETRAGWDAWGDEVGFFD